MIFIDAKYKGYDMIINSNFISSIWPREDGSYSVYLVNENDTTPYVISKEDYRKLMEDKE